MTQAAGAIHNNKDSTEDLWPVRTRAVAHVGSACVITGTGDFDLDDLNLVRRQFPDRRVTLVGDVITVWPAPPRRQ
jgi:hypothetical protein